MSRKHSRQLPVFPGVDIPVSDCAVLRETVKTTTKETPSNYISDSTCCSLLKVEVHDSTIKYGVFGRVAGESIFSLKMAAQLKFEQRVLGRCNLDRWDEYLEKLKHSISAQACHTNYEAQWWWWWWWWWIWAGFVFTGMYLVIIELTMNSSVNQSVLESNARTSVQELKPGWNWHHT